MKSSAGLLLSLVVLLGGCSAAQEKRLADGSWQIRCGEAMQRCASRADLICGDEGYDVLGGGTRGRRLGGPNGYQARVQASELVVRCGPGSAAPPATELVEPEAARVDGAASPRERSPRSEGAAQCVPGATQACVGPGGCSGGQACRDDGTGYDRCDCGDHGARSASPAPIEPVPQGANASDGSAESGASGKPAGASPTRGEDGAEPSGPSGTAL